MKYSKDVPNVSRNEALRRLAAMAATKETLSERLNGAAMTAQTFEKIIDKHVEQNTRRATSFLYRLAVRWADWRFPTTINQEK